MSIARTIRRSSCCLFLAALPFQCDAQLATSTVVHSDSTATYCSDPTRSSCYTTLPSGGSFTGFAGARAAYGSLGAEAQFTADNLLQRALEENYSRAQAEWTDRYIVPASVTHIDFVYHVTGQSDLLGDRFSTAAHFTMSAGGGLILFVVASVADGGDFVIGVDRINPFGVDVLASDITHQLDVLAGIETLLMDEYVEGFAVANFFNTVQLIGLDLFGAGGRITDVATVAGSSGHLYNVAGFVGRVPEPSTGALLLLGLALLLLATRGPSRRLG